MIFDPRPIGVFDSGIGGLTVLRELLLAFPYETFIYLGDTARLPYGSKSGNTVRKYSEQNLKFLLSRNVKAIVVACNTASTQINEDFYEGLPVYNVIDPGSHLAALTTKNNNVGILATRATVKANSYEQKIKMQNPLINVFSVPCPLFVSLAEEGWHDDVITEQVAERYLSDLKNKNIDTVVLACTHYPLLKKPIQKVLGPSVNLIDSGVAISLILKIDFEKEKVKRTDQKNAPDQLLICLTDTGLQFENLSTQLLADHTKSKIIFETVSVI
ncbi:MAG: glutamate racemase [Moraxellaceae bacterium]|nr:glutamate racemase [Pseudobdellovibrionaceae bacterium]